MKRSTKKVLTFVLASMLIGAGAGSVAAYTHANQPTKAAAAAVTQNLDDGTTMTVQGQATLSTYTNVKIDFGTKINEGTKWLNVNDYAQLGNKLKIWYDGSWQSFNTLKNIPNSVSAILYDSYIDLQVDRRFIPALDLRVSINSFTVTYNGANYKLESTKTYEVTVTPNVAVEGSEHLTMTVAPNEQPQNLTFNTWQIKNSQTQADNVSYTPFEIKLNQNLASAYETTAFKNKLLYINDYILINQKYENSTNERTLADIRLNDLDQSIYGEVSVRNDGSYLTIYVSNDWANYRYNGIYQNGVKNENGEWEFDITLREGFTYVAANGSVCKTTESQRVEIHEGVPYLYQGAVEVIDFEDKTPAERGAGDYVYELTLSKALVGAEVEDVIDGIYLTKTAYATNGDRTEERISWDYEVGGEKVIERTIEGDKITITLNDYFRAFDVKLYVEEDARVYFDTNDSEPDGIHNDTFCWEVLPCEYDLKYAEWEINYYDDTAAELAQGTTPILTVPFDSSSRDFAALSIADRFADENGEPLDLPTKVGYTFHKWVLADESDVPNGIYCGDLKIYPDWTEIVYKAVVNVIYEGDEKILVNGEEQDLFPDMTYSVTFDNIENDDTHPALNDALTSLFAQVVNQGDLNHEDKVGLTAWVDGKTSLTEDPWFFYDTYNDVDADPDVDAPIGLYEEAFSDEVLRNFVGWIFDENEGAYVHTFTVKATKQSYNIDLDYYGKVEGKANETLSVKWGEKIDLPNPEEIARTSEADYLVDPNGFWVDATWLATITDDAWDGQDAEQTVWANPNMAVKCQDYVWVDDMLMPVADVSLRAMWTPKAYTVITQFNLDNAAEEDIVATQQSFQLAIDKWFGIVNTLEDVTMVDENGDPVGPALDWLNILLKSYVPAEDAVDEADGYKWHDKFLYHDYEMEELGREQLLAANATEQKLTYTVTTERQQYTISYKNLGADIEDDAYVTKSYTWGTEVEIAAALPAREGYTFVFWQEKNDPQNPLRHDAGEVFTVPVALNTVFEAIWELNVYEVTLKHTALDGEHYVYDNTADPVVVKFSLFDQAALADFETSMGEWAILPDGSSASELVARDLVERELYLTYLPNPNQEFTYIWQDENGVVYWANNTYLELMPDLNFALQDVTYTVIRTPSVAHQLVKDLGIGTTEERSVATWEHVDLGTLGALKGKAFAGWDITYHYGANVEVNFQLDYVNNAWTDGSFMYMPAADVMAESMWLLYSNKLTVIYDCDCNACEALGGNSHDDTVYYYGIENGEGLYGQVVYHKDGIQSLLEANHRPTMNDGYYTYSWGTTSWGGTLSDLPFADSTSNTDYDREYTVILVQREIRHTLNFYWYEGYVNSVYDIFETMVNLPTNAPTRDGYTFSHWEDESGNTVSGQVMIPAGGTTVYAVWDLVNYTFRVLDDSGTALLDTTKTILDYNDQVEMERLLNGYLPSNTAEYSYAWDVAIPSNFVTRDYTFNVVKTANTYTLKVGNNAEQTVAYGTAIGGYLNPPTQLAGKTFGGWETADGTKFDENSTMPAYNCTLSPIWVLNVYNITVNYPNGTADEIKFAIEEDVANGVYKQVDALVLLKSLLPAADATATYSWEENLPTALMLRDYEFTVVAHEIIVETPDDSTSSSNSGGQGGFTSIVASCTGCSGCGSVASGLLGGLTVLGAAAVALLRKKED